MGGAPSVQAPQAPNTAQEFAQSLQSYISQAPALYQEESQYQPLYNQMQTNMSLSNAQAYQSAYEAMAPGAAAVSDTTQTMAQQQQLANLQNMGGAAAAAAIASNPYSNQIQNFSQGQLNAGPNQVYQGLLGQVGAAIPGQMQALTSLGTQVGANAAQSNAALQGLSNQVGSDQSIQSLQGIRDQVAANTRSPIFNQTAGQVMGQLGQTDPLTQQLKDMASQQLALGTSASPQALADAAQQSRAAYSARGMLNSSGSIGNEVLSQFNVGQQLLQQREAFGTGVSQLADTQSQERTQNAMGLTNTDIAATQANQQMAGQMTQAIAGINQANIGLQGSLQGQIAQNLQNATQQQAALQQQGYSEFQGGIAQEQGLQQSILGQQMAQQQLGMSGLQYLSQLGQTGQAGVLGTQSGVNNMLGYGVNSMSQQQGGPDLYNSSGLLALTNQNNMAQYNAQMSARQMNAQSSGAASGAMIGAGAGIASALAVGAVAL